MGMTKLTDVERFQRLHKVGNDDQCWQWLGNKNGNNARFRVDGRRVSAQRFAYEVAHGVTLGEDVAVMRTCMGAMCVNPAHLMAASRSEVGHMTASKPKAAPRREHVGWIADNLDGPEVGQILSRHHPGTQWVNARKVYADLPAAPATMTA